MVYQRHPRRIWKGEMSMNTMTTFEKQRESEKKTVIAQTCCRICKKPIGNKPYIQFEERFFHVSCLKEDSMIKDR